MVFKYKARDAKTVEKRAAQQGGEFDGFINDAFKTWTPKAGENWVRILPPTWEDAEHYGYDVWVHYRVGPDRASVICPHKMFDAECPICEAKVEADRDDDEDLSKSLKANRRVLVWIIDRNDEDKGPQAWAMPWTVDRDISKISRDRRSGETYMIDHPEDGYDVTFDREGKDNLTKYVGIQLARRPSSVKPKHLDFIAENPLPEVLTLRDYDEINRLFSGGKKADEPSRKASPKDDDERPSRRARDEDEERPAPSSRRARDEDDEDERPAPKRRPRDEDEEDERPAPKRASRDEEEADEDIRSAKRREAKGDEEEPPRKRTRLADVAPKDEDDDEEAPPPKTSKPASAATERVLTLKEKFALRQAGKGK